jgi:hypothetical protein
LAGLYELAVVAVRFLEKRRARSSAAKDVTPV